MKPMIYHRTYKAQRRLSPEAEIVDAREPIGYRLCASGYRLPADGKGTITRVA